MTTSSPTADAIANVQPAGGKPLIRDPDLNAIVMGYLNAYKGAKLDAAKAAVVKLRDAGGAATFQEWCQRYKAAIDKAVT
jgi:hypothetical protein